MYFNGIMPVLILWEPYSCNWSHWALYCDCCCMNVNCPWNFHFNSMLMVFSILLDYLAYHLPLITIIVVTLIWNGHNHSLVCYHGHNLNSKLLTFDTFMDIIYCGSCLACYLFYCKKDNPKQQNYETFFF